MSLDCMRKTIFLFALFYSCTGLAAELEVQLAEPQWTFILQNRPLAATEARLEPGERDFAQRIQPLLAGQEYAKVIAAFNDRPLAEDSPALQVLRGQVLLSLEKYSDAEKALQAALQTMPDLALAHRSLAMVYMLQKNHALARKHLVRSIELGVADAQVYGQLAYVNLKTAHAASAVAGYRQALFLEPENRQWQQGLLFALMNSGAMDAALAMVEQMLLDDGDNAGLWLMRGQIQLQQQRHGEALNSLEVAIRLGENAPQNQATAAQLHLQHGSISRAVDLLGDNLKRLNSENAEALLNAVEQVLDWLAYRGDWTSVSRLLAAANSQDIPERNQARLDVYRAKYALEKGQIGKAREWLAHSIGIDPAQGEALLTLADLYREQDQAAQATLYYVRAAALPDYRERALLGRAQLEIDRESYREALELLREVMQLNPGRSDIAANIRSLETLVRNQG